MAINFGDASLPAGTITLDKKVLIGNITGAAAASAAEWVGFSREPDVWARSEPAKTATAATMCVVPELTAHSSYFATLHQAGSDTTIESY